MQRGNGAHNAIKTKERKTKSSLSSSGSRSRKLIRSYRKDYLRKLSEPICSRSNPINAINSKVKQIHKLEFCSIIRRLT